MDKRWKKLGDLLVNYSMKVQPGERVMIAMVEKETYPLMHAIYEASIKVGAYPQVQFLSEELNRLVLKYGDNNLIKWIPEIEAYGMEWADVYFGLRGAHNLDGAQWARFLPCGGKRHAGACCAYPMLLLRTKQA
jgi:aminopeptidase